MKTIDPYDDDKPVGRVLSRREVLTLLGGAGAAVIAATGFKQLNFSQIASTATPEAADATLPACIVRPAETEGPYFVDEMLNRFDVRVDPADGTVKEGIPLLLKFRVSEMSANACTPLAGAQVDIWHCDALGVYSDVQDRSFNTVGQRWLRGYQVTDENGIAEVMTIYPGWYQGRTVHIHFKIRTDPASESGYEFTSQLNFDDTLSDQVFTQGVYAQKGPNRAVRNEDDGIYRDGGDQLMLNLTETSADDLAAVSATAIAAATMQPTLQPTIQPDSQDGYTAVFDIGLDLS
jgi:protocatechuate 3,4-dioxygenase beta subunit